MRHEMQTGDVLGALEPLLREGSRALDPQRQAEMGQFLTPIPVASFMASLLDLVGSPKRLLDAGAGMGTLTAAVAQETLNRDEGPRELRSIAYELDEVLVPRLRGVLELCREACARGDVRFSGEAVREDFVRAGVAALKGDMFVPGALLPESFDCAILNPPYRKLNKDSTERRALREVGIDVGNLYAAFVALAVELLKPGGELVAITPRSFCNGPYFRSFRQRFLETMALRRVHVFETRDNLFGADSVLQENVIVHAVKSQVTSGSRVVVSASVDPEEDPLLSERDYDEVVMPNDPEVFIRVVPDEGGSRTVERMAILGHSLKDLEVSISTGRVVDFRAEELLRKDPDHNTVPLVYPHNLQNGFVEWPREHAKKPSAIVCSPKAQRLLVPSGAYVLVKRFSAKEDKKTTTDEYHSVDVRYLQSENLLRSGHWFSLRWSRAGREMGSIRCAVIGDEKPERVILTYRHRSDPSGEWEEVREPVALSWTPCRYNHYPSTSLRPR
jgi:adenine-specific DNA-methyltransferase